MGAFGQIGVNRAGGAQARGSNLTGKKKEQLVLILAPVVQLEKKTGQKTKYFPNSKFPMFVQYFIRRDFSKIITAKILSRKIPAHVQTKVVLSCRNKMRNMKPSSRVLNERRGRGLTPSSLCAKKIGGKKAGLERGPRIALSHTFLKHRPKHRQTFSPCMKCRKKISGGVVPTWKGETPPQPCTKPKLQPALCNSSQNQPVQRIYKCPQFHYHNSLEEKHLATL